MSNKTNVLNYLILILFRANIHTTKEKEDKAMWDRGIIEIEGIKVHYEVKHFDEGSVFGIDEGRISKLWCMAENEIILHYERGWDVKPQTELAEKVLEILVKKFN